MPTQNAGFVPGASFTAEDYYVWTRCDGATSFKQIILMVGLGVDRTIAILRKLHDVGAITIPGAKDNAPVPGDVQLGAPDAPTLDAPLPAEGSRPLEDPTPQSLESARGSRPTRSPSLAPPPVARAETAPEAPVIELGRLAEDERGALAAGVDIPESAQRAIILARRSLNNYFDLLRVEPGVGKRQLKRAYFRFSKEFHPDRYFGHDLGPFGPWLQEVFETSTRAWNELSDSRRRKAYEARVLGVGTSGPTTQTREEHAEELFERACENEIGGDAEQALKLFGAACRINPKPAFVSRAARCALRARKLGLAEDYAKTAASLRPKDPSYARLLADVFRASGRLEEAEATILRAIELNSENDVLMTELRSDLEGVQRAASAKRSER